MKKVKCSCDGSNKKCKSCYDKERYAKIKKGEWSFNPEPPKILSSFQEQILTGGLLGDTSIYSYKHHITVGLAFGRKITDLSYLAYEFEAFKDFCSSGIKTRSAFDKRTGKTYYNCSFRTQCAEVFVPFRNKWYPNGEKIVPQDLVLSPLTCAIWFCDDGSIIHHGKNKKLLRLALYTDGFTKNDVEFLAGLLNDKLQSDLKITRKNSMKDPNKGYYIYSSKHGDAVKFIEYIQADMPNGMERKSEKWKGFV